MGTLDTFDKILNPITNILSGAVNDGFGGSSDTSGTSPLLGPADASMDSGGSGGLLAAAGIRSRSAATALSPVSGGPLAPDPRQELANTIKRLQASDPQAAQDLIDKYGPDLNPVPDTGGTGLLDKLKRTGASLVGRTLSTLNTPLNVVRGTIKEGPGAIPSALGGKDFGNIIAPEHGGGLLGFGERFVEDTLLDPTTYATLGTGAVAKSALKGVGEVGGKELAETLAKSGVKRAIAEGAADQAGQTLTRDSLKEMLLKAATDGGAKDVEKTATKQLTALDRGARGGLQLGVVPFGQGRTIIPSSTFGALAPLTEMHPVSEAVSKVFGGLGKAFIPRSAVISEAGRGTADLLGHAQSVTKAQSANAVDEFTKRLEPLAKNVDNAEIVGPVRQALEGTVDASTLSPAAKELHAAIDSERSTLLQRQLDAGTIRPDQVLDPAKYVPIQMTEAGRKALSARPAVLDSILGAEGEASKILRQGGSLEHRSFDNIDQAEKLLSDRLGPLAKGATYVEHNPATAFALRDAAAERAIAFGGTTGNSLVDRLAKDMPELVKDVPAPTAIVTPIGTDIAKLQSKAQTVQGRIKYVEGKLAGGPTRVFGETNVGRTGLVTDAAKADPVAQLAMVQHRMSLQGKLDDLGKQIADLRDSHAAEAAAREASIPVAPAGQVAIKVNEAGRHIVVPDWMAPEISKVQSVITNDETLKGVQAAVAGINHYWKSMVTVLPVRGSAFQMRNALGNVALMFSRGFTGRGIADGALAAKAAAKGEKGIEALADPWQKQLAHELLDNGITGSGFIRTDVIRKSADLAGKNAPKADNPIVTAAKHHFAGEGKFVQKGHAFNSGIEDASRASMYSDLRKRGVDQVTASLETKKALFDYGELTPFEKHAIGPYIPFYTFMRKNLGAQLWTLTHNPRALTTQAHGYQALSGSGTDPGGPLSQSAVDNGQIPMGGIIGKLLGGGSNPVMGGVDLPMLAGIREAEPILDATKLGASFVPGLSSLRKPGDIEKLGRESLNVPSGPLIDVIRSLTEATTHTSLLTGNAIKPGQEDTKLEESLAPLLGVTRRSMAKAGLAHSTFGKAIGTDQSRPESAQLASLLLGVNATPIDEASQRSEMFRRLKEAQDAVTRAKANGKTVPTLAQMKKGGTLSDIGGR